MHMLYKSVYKMCACSRKGLVSPSSPMHSNNFMKRLKDVQIHYQYIHEKVIEDLNVLSIYTKIEALPKQRFFKSRKKPRTSSYKYVLECGF